MGGVLRSSRGFDPPAILRKRVRLEALLLIRKIQSNLIGKTKVKRTDFLKSFKRNFLYLFLVFSNIYRHTCDIPIYSE